MCEFLRYLYGPAPFLLLLGGILTGCFGLLAVISKESKPPKKLAWCSFGAGLIVVFGSILTGYQDQQTDTKMQIKNNKIIELQEKNFELALKISELTKKNADLITGGDSYCYVKFRRINNSATYELYLWNLGQNPLYDVEIYIHDINKRLNVDEGIRILSDFKSANIGTMVKRIGNIPPNIGTSLGHVYFPDNIDIARVHIEIFARNGRVLQMVVFKKRNGKWLHAQRVFFKDKVVYRYLAPELPRDEEHKDYWKD